MYIYILNLIMHAYDIIYIYLDALYTTHTFVYISILYTYTHTHINHRKPVENPIFTEDAMRAPEKDSGNSSPTLRWQDGKMFFAAIEK